MLSKRTTSGDVSVGIGLMLESIVDISNRIDKDRKIPVKIDTDDYDYHIFNAVTMIREVLTSSTGFKEKDIFNIVTDDMNIIFNLYKDYNITPILMFPDYDEIIKDYIKFKEANVTEKFKFLIDCIELAKKYFKNKNGLLCPVVEFKTGKTKQEQAIVKVSDRTLLTTHILLDIELTGVTNLLETHTGKLKNKNTLNTKFKPLGKQDLTHIPFNKTTHYIFGDSTLVPPLPVKIRKEIYTISIDNKWTVHTTESKVKDNTNKIIKGIKI